MYLDIVHDIFQCQLYLPDIYLDYFNSWCNIGMPNCYTHTNKAMPKPTGLYLIDAIVFTPERAVFDYGRLEITRKWGKMK